MSAPLRFAAGLGISVALLAALFLALQVSPRAVLERVSEANPLGLAAVIGVHLFALAAKVFRWKVLLRASGLAPSTAETSAERHLVQDAVFCGWLGNLVLPAKTGELVRPLLYSRRTGASFPRVFATVVLERSVDLVVLGLGFWAVITLVETRFELPGAVTLAAGLGGAAGLGLIAALLVLWRFGPGGDGAGLEPVPAAGDPGLGARLSAALGSFRVGLSSFRQPRAIAQVVGWTAVSWALEVVGAILCIGVFDLRLEAAWAAASAHVVATTLAVSAIPLPGGLGVEQPVTVAVFQPFAAAGLVADGVLAVSLVLTLASIAWVVPLGVLGLLRQGARLGSAGLRD